MDVVYVGAWEDYVGEVMRVTLTMIKPLNTTLNFCARGDEEEGGGQEGNQRGFLRRWADGRKV